MTRRPKLVAQQQPDVESKEQRRRQWVRYISTRSVRGLIVFAVAFALIRAFCAYALPDWQGATSVLYPLLFSALVAANTDLMLRSSVAHLKPKPRPQVEAGPMTLELERQRVAARRRMGLIP